MLWWWFKQTLKFPLYSPHTLLYSVARNCSIWITIDLVMSSMYGHRISKGELYLRGNCLKIVRSKNMLWKKFEVLNYKVLIPPGEVFETFEVGDVELSLILSIEKTCKMSFLINTNFLLFIYS